MIALLLVTLTGVVAAVAVDRWLRAARTRRQAVDALAVVPELAGVSPAGAGDRAATTAAAVAEALGVSRREVAEVATAARLHGLAALLPEGDAVARARAVHHLATESGLTPSVAALMDDVLATPSGRTARAAAAVRVATTYEARRAEPHATPAGALFATVRAHPGGHEHRAAAALVRLAQEGRTSA